MADVKKVEGLLSPAEQKKMEELQAKARKEFKEATGAK